MKNETIFSYDKTPRCEYCLFFEESAGTCTQGMQTQPCESFKYDVFRRVPRRTPTLPAFDAEDFKV